MKNLIRNGGFERGTTDFWMGFNAKSFTADLVTPYKGAYAGKLVADGSNQPFIITNDYIPLTVGEICQFEAHIRSPDMFMVYFTAVYYDEGLEEIAQVTYKMVNPSAGSYNHVVSQIPGIEDSIYVRMKIQMVDTTLDRYLRIDNVLMYKYLPEDVMAREIVMDERVNLAAASTYTGAWISVLPFKEAEFVLWVNDFVGAANTLDVKIVSRVSFENNDIDIDIATFEQVTTGSTLAAIVLNEGIGSLIRTDSVLGGAPTNVDFVIYGRFKR